MPLRESHYKIKYTKTQNTFIEHLTRYDYVPKTLSSWLPSLYAKKKKKFVIIKEVFKVCCLQRDCPGDNQDQGRTREWPYMMGQVSMPWSCTT